MLPASKQFSEAVVTDTRRVLGRVIVDYTDPFMDQGISISASEQINPATMLPQVADNILTPARRWASCDGSTLVDGNSFPAPAVAADGQMGWWGSQLSDTGSMFIATFPTVTLTFISRPIHSLRVVGDSARGEFPVDFEIRLLGVGSVVRHTQIVTGNALVDWQVNIIPVTEVTQYVVEVRRWSHAGRQAKVLEAFTSVQETYEGDDIIGISLLEERELAQQSLPVGNVSANEITLRLDNSTRKFDAGNRQSSLYQLLVQNRRIRAWLGVLPERTVTETTQAEWALGTLSGVRATPVGDLVLDEAARTSFTRGSTAHQQNGTLVNTNLPRYEFARFPNWRWRDLFDTNQLATEYVSGGDAVATWSVTGGVLSATGGTRATLLKTSLTLTDGEIIINTDQAHDGGIIARHVDNSNYYTLKLSDASGAFPVENLRLVRRVAGVITQLASANVTWVRGVSANVRFTFHGSLLEAWFNGVRVISVVDTSFVAGGVGLRNNHTTAFRVLDFTVHQAQRGITVEEGVTNLLPVAVSRAESGLLSIHNTFGTIATDTTFGRSSAPSARYTQIAVGGFQGFYTAIFLGITAGLAYTASVHVFSAMRSLSNVNFDLMWRRADNSTISRASSFHTNTVNQWSRFVIAATAPAEATQVIIILHGGSGIQVGDVFWFNDVQLEQKPYAASWQPGGSPRAAEVLTVPSSVFNRGNWTVEGVYTPQIPMTLGNILKTLKSYQIDANNNLWFGITADARWRLAITSGGTVRAVESATGAAVIGTPYHWQIGGDGSVMRLCVNGVQIGTDTAYVEPVGALPVNIHIGASQDIVLQANGLIHNVRFSNRARSLAEHQAAFNTGQPLAVDAATTYLARFDGSLLNSAYLLSGTRTSPAVDMSFLTETETAISSWTAAIPIGTALAVETSLNEGSSWHTATNGGQIAGIVAGQNMVGIRLLTRQVLTTQDAGVTPQLHGLTITQINRDYVPLGTFWSGEWHATSEKLYASTTGRDRLELLRKSTYAMSQVAVNRSLHALATAVLTDAGLTTAEYWIDPALHNIIVPSAWFSTLSHREALRQIAEASLGQVYTDRNGVVRVESVGHLLGQESFVNPLMTSTQSLTITADNYFRKDTPIKWGELANRVEVETQPLRAVATTQEVFRSNEPVAIAAGQTVVLTVRYNEPPVIEAVASLSGAPAGAAITAATYFAWGATVTVTNGTNAGTFTLLINGKLLTILNRERATAEDLVSIRDNGLLRYEYPANHLVQTLARAQTIADTLLRLYRHPRRDLTMDWRGNPALTLGDMIITRDHQDWLRYWVTKQEIDYDGALRARLEGRLAR